MDLNFEVTIKLCVSITDCPMEETEETYDKMVKIRLFINEFFKYPSAVLSYYRSCFMDEYIVDTAADWDELANYLSYLPDYGPLFIEIAKNCSSEVSEFIEYIFSEDTNDQEQNIKKGRDREILEDEMRNIKVTFARFIKL
jgi:hypothetical protein